MTDTRAEVLKNLSQGSHEWHRKRAYTLGASEIAMIAGLSPYGDGDTMLQLKFKFTEPTNAMKRGNDMEDEAAALYKKVCVDQITYCAECGISLD